MVRQLCSEERGGIASARRGPVSETTAELAPGKGPEAMALVDEWRRARCARARSPSRRTPRRDR